MMLSSFNCGDDSISNLSCEELQKSISDIKTNTSKEILENECYKSFLGKLNIEIEKPPPSASRRASLVRKRSKSRSSALDRLITLSFEQKCLILQTQYEEFRNHVEQQKKEYEERLDTQKAVSEELKTHQEAITKSYNLFEKLVSKERASSGTRFLPAGKFLQFSDDYCKFLDTLSDKLRLKNSSLKTALKKIKEQLRQKKLEKFLVQSISNK
ncbi:unnamed protein product [Heterobilharzia americana]|nr:unnamed protein product [Heterobilharzia americana]